MGPESHNISSPKLLNLTGPKQERVACNGAPNHINVKPKLLNFTDAPRSGPPGLPLFKNDL